MNPPRGRHRRAPAAAGAPLVIGARVEYHTLYGVDRTRLTTRIPITVLGKDSQYGRIVCGMCCQMSGPERSSRRSDSSSLDCTYKGSSPGQSVEPDTGQEWQPTTHRSHGDSTAIDDLPGDENGSGERSKSSLAVALLKVAAVG